MQDETMLSGNPVSPWQGEPAAGFPRLTPAQQIATARRPEMYVAGDALYGWHITDTRPVNEQAMTWGGQNYIRQELNTLENPRGLLGDNLAYQQAAEDMIAKGKGEVLDPWRNPGDALRNLIPFGTSNEDALAPILQENDPSWDGLTEWRAWREKYPDVAQYLVEQRGLDPDKALAGTRNRDAFMFAINMEMTKAKYQQDIDAYDKESGRYAAWTQFLGGGAIRQFGLDSDAAKTLGLGAVGRPLSMGAKAATGIKALQTWGAAGRTLSILEKAGRVDQVVHNTLAKSLKLRTGGALAAEGFGYGAGWSIQNQLATQDIAEWIGQSPMELDASDALEAGSLGAVFGLGMYGAFRGLGAASGTKSVKTIQQAMGVDDTPLGKHGLTPEGLTLQAADEDGMQKINRVLSEAVDNRLGFLMSRPVVESSGRTIPEVAAFADNILTLRKRGVRISDAAMVEAVDDFLSQGTLQHLTQEERLRVERAKGGEEALALRQANPQWVAQMGARRLALAEALRRVESIKGDTRFIGGPQGLRQVSVLGADDLNAALEPLNLSLATSARAKRSPIQEDVVNTLRRQIEEIDRQVNTPANPQAAALRAASQERTLTPDQVAAFAGKNTENDVRQSGDQTRIDQDISEEVGLQRGNIESLDHRGAFVLRDVPISLLQIVNEPDLVAVKAYAARAGDKVPPIVAGPVAKGGEPLDAGKELLVTDGKHRIAAARLRGEETIQALVPAWYAKPSKAVQAVQATGYAPRSQAGRLIADLQRQLSIVAEQRALGGKGAGNAVKAAREEIRKLTASMTGLYGKPALAPKKVRLPSSRKFNRMTDEEQVKFLDELFEKLEGTPTEVWHSTSYAGRAMDAIGYEGALRNYIASRTGAHVTSRAVEPLMRAASMLFGNAEYGAAVAAGKGGQGVGLVSAMSRAHAEPYQLRHSLEELRHRKGMTEEAWRDFNEVVIDAMNERKRMPKGHPLEKEGNIYIELHDTYNNQVMQRGLRNGSLRRNNEVKKSVFLPSIVNDNYVRANFREFVETVARVWRAEAQGSPFVNPEVAFQLDWLNRPVDKFGNRIGKAAWSKQITAKPAAELTAFPKRDDLLPEFKAEYDEALANIDLTRSAETFAARQIREDGRATDVRSLNDKVYGSNSHRRRLKRRITQVMMNKYPELKPFYVQDLFSLVEHQSRTTGFATHAADSIERMIGVAGAPAQIMDVIEAKLKSKLARDPAAAKEVEQGFDRLHDMLSWMTGSLPDVDPSYATANKFFYDALSRVVSLPVLGKQAVINVVEGARMMFFAVHDPVDFGRNMKAFARGLFADRSVLREEFAGMHNDWRRMSTNYGNQLRMGNVDDAFELTTSGQLTRPFSDAWRLITGKQKSSTYGNRVGAAFISGLEGLGKSAYTLGGGPRIQHATEVVIGRATQREFQRYSKAALKLRAALAENPIDLGDEVAGHKVFASAARKAGFGDRWDIAERIIRYNLHEEGITEALIAAADKAPVKNKIHTSLNDLLETYTAMPDGPEKSSLYEGIQRYRQYVEERVMEELGETQAWSARTDKRTSLRQALDLMTNYMHNMYFYKISKGSVMPSRVFLGILTGYVVSETIQKVLQDYLNGATEDELVSRWDTPEESVGSVLSNSTRLPLFGAISFIPKYVLDSGIDTFHSMRGNDSIEPFAPKYGGVVGSGLDAIFRLGRGINQYAFGLTERDKDKGLNTATNAGIRYLPLVNSAYGQLAVRTLTEWKQRQNRNTRASLTREGDGRSIWGDDDQRPGTARPEMEQPTAEFDLNAALDGDR